MALCRITGTLYFPDGTPVVLQDVQFRKADVKIKSGYLGAIVPDFVNVSTDNAGNIDVSLITGTYKIYVKTTTISLLGNVIVPDEDTALISDILDLTDIPEENPTWLTQAFEARTEAQKAAESAILAAEGGNNRYATVAAGLAATSVGEYFTVPSLQPGIASTLYYHESGGTASIVAQYPDAQALEQLRTQLQTRDLVGDYLVSFVDPTGRATALTVRQSDGMFSQFVINDIGDRLEPRFSRAKVLTDTTKIAIWGASDVKRMDAAFQALGTELGVEIFIGTNNGAFLDSIWAEQGSRPQQVQFAGNTLQNVATAQTVTWLNGTDRPAIRPYDAVIRNTGYRVTAEGNQITRKSVISGFTQPVTFAGPVVLDSENGAKWADAVQIWSVGRNDLGVAESDFRTQVMNATDNAYDLLPTLDKKVLVLGHWNANATSAGSAFRARITAVNTYYRNKYQERFIDVGAYLLSSQVWTDTGITPTSADTTQQSLGNLPMSLSDGDGLHLNSQAASAVVNNLIKPRLFALGWYSSGGI